MEGSRDEDCDERGSMTAPGTLLPAMSLVSIASGEPVDLRAAKGPQALVTLHSVTCRDCRRYVRERLARGAREIAEWGGRLTIVVPDVRANAATFAETTTDALEIVLDPEGAFDSGHAGVVIADEWGEVHFMADAGAGHDLPSPEEVVEWVRFLAIQCPECEGPEGEWRTTELPRTRPGGP
jgi:hypothetical protein